MSNRNGQRVKGPKPPKGQRQFENEYEDDGPWEEDYVHVDFTPEYASPARPNNVGGGGKRQNKGRKKELVPSHMLNFTRTPPPTSSSSTTSSSTSRRKREVVTPFVKEKFVQANFRFVLRPGGKNYDMMLFDPDVPPE
eukprot:CAMPEP_0201512170 /NCGR_PEP_ID=MMETSP0161_2-20130828/4482_1 /ASSEMBLY_ACC=CAM_ASM_000251 /TAXON_ID=180227 /ORGANISM="Neoparamoeba aestuarina, Strain SoJaBio B1-5/56/2" /LENGTH=137 /DNA_ID=CAMNT_0047907913 /DNA_START=242 /DNA_END=652 /DNA_ORIENTATION=+